MRGKIVMIGSMKGGVSKTVLSNCDRMDGTGKKTSPSEMNGLIATYLGRTYRKFIEAGLKIYLDDRQVYMHDPLYVSGPTQFDTKEKQDPKAEMP